jgi:Zn-dependent M28 family amino/carboxypeptidase
MIRMPGKSYTGSLSQLTNEQCATRDAIQYDIEQLADEIGERNVYKYANLCEAADFIHSSFEQAGYEVERQSYVVAGNTCYNIEVEISGDELANEIVIVGAHYDTVFDCPGANDNGSGVAALLELAKAFSGRKTCRSLRFVAFVNEEPPHFQYGTMGSLVYAKRCREQNEKIVAMLSLETIGYYSEKPGSQHYPFPVGFFYPSKGNFIAFVGNISSRRLVHKVVESFRRQVQFPSEGGAWPGFIKGVGWSDHWAFWQMGYPAVMVTDTALFRYQYYHTALDTPDRICYEQLIHVVDGLRLVLVDLVGDNKKHKSNAFSVK